MPSCVAPELHIYPLGYTSPLLTSGGKTANWGSLGLYPVRAVPRCDYAQMSQELSVKSHGSSPSKWLDKVSHLAAGMSDPLFSPIMKVSTKSYETLVQRKKEKKNLKSVIVFEKKVLLDV